MRRLHTRLGFLVVLPVALQLFAGCGKSSVATPVDGGDASWPQSGRRSFDVTAVLKNDASSSLPSSNSFTLVLDDDARVAIGGGNGLGAVVGVTSTDGRSYRSGARFRVGTPTGGCGIGESVSYDAFEVTVSDGALSGTATGFATVSCGDCAFDVPFSATLSGVADQTPPTLRFGGTVPATPFDGFGLAASEPLPAGATARLVADDDGTAIDLIPQVVDGAVPLVVGFSKPDVVLRPGRGYSVTLDGLVDFAGQTDRGPRLQLTGFPAAPLLPEDGFESATGSSLGGAVVMRAGPLPAIAGDTSLYVAGRGAPAIDFGSVRSLAVRLARQAGDTKLRFSYRMVGTSPQPSFWGSLRVGSEGASPGTALYSFGNVMVSTEMLTISGQPIYTTTVGVAEVMLPADATDEVLLVIAPTTLLCGPLFDPNGGMLIDDLRLE